MQGTRPGGPPKHRPYPAGRPALDRVWHRPFLPTTNAQHSLLLPPSTRINMYPLFPPVWVLRSPLHRQDSGRVVDIATDRHRARQKTQTLLSRLQEMGRAFFQYKTNQSFWAALVQMVASPAFSGSVVVEFWMQMVEKWVRYTASAQLVDCLLTG